MKHIKGTRKDRVYDNLQKTDCGARGLARSTNYDSTDHLSGRTVNYEVSMFLTISK